MKRLCVLFLFFSLSPLQAGDDLASRIDAVIHGPEYRQAHWGLLVVDSDHTVKTLNPSGRRLLGMPDVDSHDDVRHVLFGAADFMPPGARRGLVRLAWHWLRRPRLDPLAMISQNRGLLAFNLIWLWESVERVPAAYAELAELGLPAPHVGARYPFAAARDALVELKTGRTVGKSVLLTDAPA